MRSMLLRCLAVLGGVWATTSALAQERVPQLQDPSFAIALVILFICIVPIAIVGIINYSEYRQSRERLAAVERLVAAGHTVPPELMVPEPLHTLAEERRRDARLGITLLCWALGVALVFYLITGEPRWASWGLLFLIPGLGSFLKAWLTARELARGADGAR